MAKDHWSNLNTPLIVTIGLIGTIIMFGVVVPGLQALVVTMEDNYWRQQRGGQANAELQAHRYEQRQRITTDTPRWIDQGKGVVAISIDRAMTLYAEQHGQPARPDGRTEPEDRTARGDRSAEPATP